MGFDPASLAIEGTIASGISAGVGAIGALSSASAQAASANYNAEVASNNAKIQQQNATFAAQEGEQNAATQEQKTRAEVGSIKAAQAANNIDVNTGSAVDVRSSASELGELNAINIRANAARQAYGYQTAATSDQAQAALDKAQAGYAETAGDIGAATTFLGGAGSAALNYGRFLTSNSITGSTGSF